MWFGGEPATDIVPAKKPRTVEATLCPHEGRLVLSKKPSGGFHLAHLDILEQLEVPSPGEWALVFDEDGFCALCDEREEDGRPPIIVEHFLKRPLYCCDDGELIVRENLRGNFRQ